MAALRAHFSRSAFVEGARDTVPMLVGIVPLLLFVAIGGPVAVAGIVLIVLWCLAVGIVASALTGIFQVALYRFAIGSPVPGFEPAQLEGSFRPRRNGRRASGFFGGE